jgi:cytochrome P450
MPASPPPLARSAGGEWTACRYADVQAILADDRFRVGEAGEGGAVGTVSWLRASVSRFANGAEHERRRKLAVDELRLLDSAGLRRAAHRRALAVLGDEEHPGGRVELMRRLARRVPMAALAASMGIADPEAAARAVIGVAAAYFPSAAAAEPSADAATAELVAMLGPADLDVIVARIALLVQGCDATAGLIGNALHLLQDCPEDSGAWSSEDLLAEAARHTPPLRASRRVASEAIAFGANEIRVGEIVVCDVETANRDPAVFDQPQRFDPTRRRQQPSLTFGYGVRPCPGARQALALAAGVLDAVRERCTLVPGAPVELEPSGFLRIPRELEAVVTTRSGT